MCDVLLIYHSSIAIRDSSTSVLELRPCHYDEIWRGDEQNENLLIFIFLSICVYICRRRVDRSAYINESPLVHVLDHSSNQHSTCVIARAMGRLGQ